MKSIKMSYRGFGFEVNPKSVKAEYSRAESTALLTKRRAISHELCEMPLVVSGTGRFYGENAREKMQELLSVYKKGGAAYLFSPVFPPVKAHFLSLSFTVSADSELIDYSFRFKESENKKLGAFDFGYTLAGENENLFDIAARTGVAIEKIIDLNSFEEPFSVREGDRVWLK